MAFSWTDEIKKQVIDEYESREPTAENSMEIVKEIAEDIEATPNGVRAVLSKAGVYVKKAAPTSSSSSSDGGEKKQRVSKQDCINALAEKIEDRTGNVPNMEILDKLTGKAAQYLAEVVDSIK